MELVVSKDRSIRDVQHAFNARYPFLRLEFYRPRHAGPELPLRKHLLPSTLLRAAGLNDEGVLEIRDEMTVAELEKALLEKFGLNAQLSRSSGALWLETTMTDSWTLRKQNEHGREITLSSSKSALTGEDKGNI